MARVIKKGARKPIIADGAVWRSTHVNWAPPIDGFVKAIGADFTVVVSGKDAGQYEVHLTEIEMLSTVEEWLAEYRRVIERRNKKAAQGDSDAS